MHGEVNTGKEDRMDKEEKMLFTSGRFTKGFTGYYLTMKYIEIDDMGDLVQREQADGERKYSKSRNRNIV